LQHPDGGLGGGAGHDVAPIGAAVAARLPAGQLRVGRGSLLDGLRSDRHVWFLLLLDTESGSSLV
jgi:hypothetical protein